MALCSGTQDPPVWTAGKWDDLASDWILFNGISLQNVTYGVANELTNPPKKLSQLGFNPESTTWTGWLRQVCVWLQAQIPGTTTASVIISEHFVHLLDFDSDKVRLLQAQRS